jgi:hypothetical protein
MNSLTALPKSPQELRPLLHQRLDAASDEEIRAVHRMLMEMEARRLYNELGEEFAEDWKTGRLTKENIDEAIREHRHAHPYR